MSRRPVPGTAGAEPKPVLEDDMAPSELLISSDSHVMESIDLWNERLPAGLRERAPSYEMFRESNPSAAHPGGNDGRERVKEMMVDGVSGEVLYPTVAMDQFGIKDPALQEACFRVYNDWLIEYCSAGPKALYGVACISVYNIENAVKEMERCKKAGMRGVLIWQVPPDVYSFASNHYEKFWAAAQDLEMPVSLHILTGEPFAPGELIARVGRSSGLENLRNSVNVKLLYVTNALLDIIGSGVLERFPQLKLVLVENEISWIPFILSQWDKYSARGGRFTTAMKMLPSEYFKRQIYATFFNDAPIRQLLSDWGYDNCMWSNDFPHPNSTWPHSREVIERDLGHLPANLRAKLVSENVTKLYKL
jgi:predicted TIM-barrel fold metal-dependent hydrolase